MKIDIHREIHTEEAEQNLLSHVRYDCLLLHSHPWIDDADGRRRKALRKDLRDLCARIRRYRQRKSALARKDLP